MAQPPQRLRRQFFTLSTGRVIASGLSALWFVVAARHLTVEEMGDLGLLLSLSAMLGVVADLGYPVVLTREVARAGALHRNVLLVVVKRRLVGGLVASAGVVGLYWTASSRSNWWLAVVLCVSILSTAVYSTITAGLRGVGVVVPDACNEVVSRLLVLVLGWALLAHGGGVVTAVVIYVVADVLSMIGLLLVGMRASDADADVATNSLRLRNVFPIGFASLLAVLYYRIDVWLLGVFKTSAEVAEYVAAYRILDGLLLPAGVMGVLVLGRVARLDVGGRGSYTVRMALITGGLVIVPAAVLALVAAPVLGTVFGADYRAGSPTLVWLLASAPAGALVMVMAPVVSTESPRRIAPLVGVALLVNALLNVVAIPTFGPRGAAAATLVSQVGLVVLLYRAIRRPTVAIAPTAEAVSG